VATGGRRRGAATAHARAAGGDDAPRFYLWVALIAVATGGVVAVADGGNAYWLCVPGVLLACAQAPSRIAAALGGAAVAGAAALPMAGWLDIRPLPSPLLAVLVPAASVAIQISLRERLEREREALRDVALTDPLTGIANRRELLARAEYEIARHARGRHSFALVMLDLDGFKLLNDRFGHAAGDELLCDVASALLHAIRAQDTVARIGGDEFCVLAPETDAPRTLPLAKRITEAVTDATAGVETLRASIGIAVFPGDGESAPDLLHAADERLLAAKRDRNARRGRRRAA
jgi:diguanylate cyclase (GGDEF)-like protein